MDYLDRLNEAQRQAVETLEGPLLVLAGAGSGKTRVVTYRIVNLLRHNVSPSSILGLTFTNKAAQEMRHRVHQMTQSNVLISTFHSLGSRILRESIDVLGYRRDFTLYDEEDSNRLLRSCCQQLDLGEEKSTIKAMKSYISNIKNHPLNIPEEAVGKGYETKVYHLYQAKLKEYNAVDFDDLLLLPVRIFEEFPDILESYQNRWQYLLIDEYQDTNEAQYLLIKFLTAKTHNICAVGDPDQSIYSWRGAQIQNIINFEKDFPGAKVVLLEQNYRSHTNILEVANSLISHNTTRHEKKLWSALGEGPKIKHFVANSEKEEADYVGDRLNYHHQHDQLPWNHMVVFYRTHAQSRIFEDFFYSHRVPYVIVGGVSFYQRREVKDILAFLKIVHSGSDFIAFSRTINLPKRGIGHVTLEKMRHGASEEGLGIIDYCAALVNNTPLKTSLRLSGKQKESLAGYLQMIQELRQGFVNGTLRDLVMYAIAKSDYLSYLKEDKETFEEREANLNALVGKAAEWESMQDQATLASFLEELSLKSNLDEADNVKERVHLMSIHNGKGLEYDLVFLVGLEEDLFPHINSREDADKLEEERRLCYVGITRTKERLYLTHAKQRLIWGTSRRQFPSRFLSELPSGLIEVVKKGYASTPQSTTNKLPIHPVFKSDPKETSTATEETVAVAKTGQLVSHQLFGIGVIQSITTSQFGPMYRILFSKDSQERTIIAKLGKLTIL